MRKNERKKEMVEDIYMYVCLWVEHYLGGCVREEGVFGCMRQETEHFSVYMCVRERCRVEREIT